MPSTISAALAGSPGTSGWLVMIVMPRNPNAKLLGGVAAAAFALGLDVLREPAFWWAVAAVVLVGPINLTVSFYLAFQLALRSQAISQVNRRLIRAALWRRLRVAPMSFLVPPANPPEDDDADPAAPTQHG